ncbi:unnamed protein product [Lasius platythorax]|uniref:Uncharacterized protein n=1 Tax=Lasius platythorax TaxID=488582 RepID=A0AAV2NTG3_9HYME
MTSVRFNSNSVLCNQCGDCIGGLTQGMRPLSGKLEITEHYVSAPITFGLSNAYIHPHTCASIVIQHHEYESLDDCFVYTTCKYSCVCKAGDIHDDPSRSLPITKITRGIASTSIKRPIISSSDERKTCCASSVSFIIQ